MRTLLQFDAATPAVHSPGCAKALSLLLGMALVLSACSGGGSGGGSSSRDTGGTTGSESGGTGGTDTGDFREIELPAPRLLLPELAQAKDNFESDHYSGNGVCAACHNDTEGPIEDRTMVVFEETGPKDVSLGIAWETSTMANSTRDPYWHAVYATELDNYPNIADEINDTCTRCHAPMANDVGRKTGEPIHLFDKGSVAAGDFEPGLLSMSAADPEFNHAMDGVSCSVCHQISDDGNLGTEASFTGGFKVEQYPVENLAERPAYGQYQNVDVAYMQNQANFKPVYGAHISQSETCATCHNLMSETVDRDGNPLPDGGHRFSEQAMFTEWQLSDYNTNGGATPASCQSCHMPKLDLPVRLANAGSDVKQDNFAEHTFLGANTVMQDMMQNYKPELGISDDIDFQPSIERNREFLKTSASVEIAPVGSGDGTVSFDVDITNHTGHKLPSGYHSRRVYLHVMVTDANGAQVFESGRIKANGAIVGNSEDADADTWEPHYDLITSASQVQVYQAIMGNSDDERTHSLLNGVEYYKDNRITPTGFNKNTAPESVAVTGEAMSDADFNLGRDTVSYQVPVTGQAPFNVRAELRYQPLSYGHLAKLFGSQGYLDAVDRFRTIYETTTLRDEIITVGTATVQ